MGTHVATSRQPENSAIANQTSMEKSDAAGMAIGDKSKQHHRPVLQKMATAFTATSPSPKPDEVGRNLSELVNSSPQARQAAQLQTMADSYCKSNNKPVQRKENRTGLPDHLKSGVENLSGYSLDDVKVHFNSAKPAQLQAHAYAEGSNIHLAPGQEKHLPHEAWHVVQQKQGRVSGTKQLKGISTFNDDPTLEAEADRMGQQADMQHLSASDKPLISVSANSAAVQAKLEAGKLNVAGESHDEYEQSGNETLRDRERTLATRVVGGNYWRESAFKVTGQGAYFTGKSKGESGDPILFQFLQTLELIGSLGGDALQSLDVTDPDEAKVLKRICKDIVGLITGGVNDRHKSLIAEHNSGVKTVSDSNIEVIKTLWQNVLGMNQNCLDILQSIEDDGSLKTGTDPVVVTGQKAAAVRLNGRIKQQTTVLNNNTNVTSDNVRVTRSQEMHQSAQASFETPGIWKIGNNHVLDIIEYTKSKLVRNPKYNLISKQDFIAERDQLFIDHNI